MLVPEKHGNVEKHRKEKSDILLATLLNLSCTVSTYFKLFLRCT